MVTAANVATWSKLTLPTGGELALLELVIAAVTEHVETHYTVSDPLTDSQELAIVLQCSRLWRRRDTPEGVIAFDELGAVRISKLDPDVDMLLRPQWGFA